MSEGMGIHAHLLFLKGDKVMEERPFSDNSFEQFLNEEKLERPVVRLVYNGHKKKIDHVDINLTEEEDVKIETVLF